MKIATASWFSKLPDTHLKVGISRGAPRGLQAGTYRRYGALAPGAWFKSVTPQEYLRLYGDILAGLNPADVAGDLIELGNGKVPTMLCFEGAKDIQSGTKWCHRHLAAQWLEEQLGIKVEEVDNPDLDRFAYLKQRDVPLPSYQGDRFKPRQGAMALMPPV